MKARSRNRDALVAALGARFAELTTDEWMARLRGVVPAAPVQSMERALDTDRLRAAGHAGRVRPSDARPGALGRRAALPVRLRARLSTRARAWARTRTRCSPSSGTTPRRSMPFGRAARSVPSDDAEPQGEAADERSRAVMRRTSRAATGLALASLLASTPVGAVDDYGPEADVGPVDGGAPSTPSIAAPSPTAATAETSIALVRIEDPLFGIASVDPGGMAGPRRRHPCTRHAPERPGAHRIAVSTGDGGGPVAAAPAAACARRGPGGHRRAHDVGIRLGSLRVRDGRREHPGRCRVGDVRDGWLELSGPSPGGARRGPRCCATRSSCPPSTRFEVLAPEPTPDPATLGYQVEEVTFPGGSDGVDAGRHADPAQRARVRIRSSCS